MTDSKLLSCRQCGSHSLLDRGALRPDRRFAGMVLPTPLPGGRLFDCAACGLSFRDPILSSEDYANLYASAPDDVWPSSGQRMDQRSAQEKITAVCVGGDILDVGCYDGSFLASFGPTYRKFGVEASLAACVVAERNGVSILANDIKSLPSIERLFDVVVALDVIEHVANPRSFLEALARVTKPGGVVVIGTGDADAPSWRRFGPSYWYCTNVEHISFISKNWSQRAAQVAGMQLVECELGVRHGLPGGATVTLRDRLQLGMRRVVNAVWPKRPRLAVGRAGMFKDHLVAVFKRPNLS